MGLRRFVSWTPQIVGMLFAGFITPFVVDVFGQSYGLWGTIAALAMQLITTGLTLIALAVAWR